MGRLSRNVSLYIVAGSLLVIVATTVSRNAAFAGALSSIAQIEKWLGIPDETDAKAPVDYGPGPGVKPGVAVAGKELTATHSAAASSTSSSQIPVGGAAANTTGVFGPAVTWPLIPIHAVLLPDGRLMSYGTDGLGNQGSQLIYDIWDPRLGTGTSAHLVLPNRTSTDIFCGAQSVMLSGDVLTSGGDLTVNGARNSANNNTTIFSPAGNTLTANTPMTYARWYGSLVALPNGQLAIFGGRQNVGTLNPVVPSTTPELYDPALRAWTSLTGATSVAAFGANWWYPRSFVAPGGSIFVLTHNGPMFFVSTAGAGSVTQSKVVAPKGDLGLPTVPFAPGKALSVRLNQQVVVVDYRTSTPVVTPTSNIDQVRIWSNGTILADGKVLVTGGSQVDNELTGVDYQAQIWNPITGLWTAGASAAKPRLYHSTAMLLPDATVLTAGGGAPGPVANLNAEIYYPPYLYAAGGTPAVRPVIAATASHALNPGATVAITVGPTDVISRLTFVRTGSATHSSDVDQRFIDLPFTQEGQNVTAVLPTDTTTLVPGFYMLFAFNDAGMPSVASIINIAANGTVTVSYAVSPTSVAFGTVQTGTASGARSVTVTNSGSAALPIIGITFSGASASRFSQTNTCGASLPVGSTCTINVVFTPISSGYVWATLNVSGSGVTHTAMVNGTGIVPFTVSPATLAFGNVPVNTASAARSVTATNTGSAALPITSITFSGASAGRFSQTNTCGASLPVGSACAINVTLTPISAGYVWATLFIDTPGLTHSATVAGTGF
jgi:hypothetical protein